MPIAYEGTEPYIFVSYAHRDSSFVMPVIRRLQREGFRVWYDEGIEAGSEWPDYIASHLKRSACVISMVSDNFAQSLYCRQELTYAQKYKKAMLNVYMEEADLSDGLEMQLSSNQAIYRNLFPSEEAFLLKLCSAKILQSCRIPESGMPVIKLPEYEIQEKEDPEETSPDRSLTWKLLKSLKIIAEEEEDTEEPLPLLPEPSVPMKPEEDSGSRGWNFFVTWTAILLEFSYMFLGPKAMEMAAAEQWSMGKLILMLIVPHVFLAVTAVLAVHLTRRKTSEKVRSEAIIWAFLLNLLTTLGSSFIGMTDVPVETGLIVKFLISLGLNLLSGILVALIYLYEIGSTDSSTNDDDAE